MLALSRDPEHALAPDSCPVNTLPINARISDFSQTFRSDRDGEDALPGDGVRQRR